MANDQKLYELCRDLIESSSIRIKNIIANGEKIPSEDVDDLVKRGGNFEVKRRKKLSVVKLIQNHYNEFFESKEAQSVKNYLAEMGKKSLTEEKVEQVQSRGDSLLKDLLILGPLIHSYFDTKGSYLSFDLRKFDVLYNEMEDFLYFKVQFHYFAPIPRFRMKVRKLELLDGLTIRKIPHDKLVKIAGLNQVPVITAFGVTYSFDDLHYMLELYSGRPDDALVYDSFANVIKILRVFKEGEIGVSSVFHSVLWRFTYESTVPASWKVHFYHDEYLLDAKEAVQFKRFYQNIQWLLANKKDVDFLKLAISRFSSGLEEEKPEDRIIDFMIALEAMYSVDNRELSYRISYRIANLLAENDRDRNLLFLLVRQSYDRRSSLVHGAEFKPIKITKKALGMGGRRSNDMIYNADKIALELEKITRDSIKKFLKLVMFYHKREDILGELDLCYK